ncbi:hypothetical protein [Bradyrhizobium sp. BR 1433]|uniref:hypothetical protein n=1 Tax=Bradyrhizobium sp. BR 1433 TaxID=3447967 RepID=UPI003EE7862C
MENAASDRVAARLDEGNDPCGLIVTDLVALIGHVQASLRLIEAAIAREALPRGRPAATPSFSTTLARARSTACAIPGSSASAELTVRHRQVRPNHLDCPDDAQPIRRRSVPRIVRIGRGPCPPGRIRLS